MRAWPVPGPVLASVNSLREYARAITGRGRTALNDVFSVIGDLYVTDEPRRQRLRSFWQAAEAIEVLPVRRLITRSPEILAYCTREALGEIGKAALGGSARTWRHISRDVVAAAEAYRVARELPGSDPARALNALMASVGELEDFHKSETDSNARALHNLVFQVTGARLVGPVDAARQFSRLLKQLNDVAHGSGSWADVMRMRQEASVLLRRLFSPPDTHLAALDALASAPAPTAEHVASLQQEITNQHHVRYFLERIPSCTWLERLGPHEMLAPPSRLGEPWPVGFVADRLGRKFPKEFAEWLTIGSNKWGGDPVATAHLAAAALAAGEESHALLLSLLTRHPADQDLKRVIRRAVLEADPTLDFVMKASELLL